VRPPVEIICKLMRGEQRPRGHPLGYCRLGSRRCGYRLDRDLVQDRINLLYLFAVVDHPIEIERNLPVWPELRAGAEYLRRAQRRRGSEAILKPNTMEQKATA
jgi:hypothetical protein